MFSRASLWRVAKSVPWFSISSRVPAVADPEDEAPAGDLVDRGDQLGGLDRIALVRPGRRRCRPSTSGSPPRRRSASRTGPSRRSTAWAARRPLRRPTCATWGYANARAPRRCRSRAPRARPRAPPAHRIVGEEHRRAEFHEAIPFASPGPSLRRNAPPRNRVLAKTHLPPPSYGGGAPSDGAEGESPTETILKISRSGNPARASTGAFPLRPCGPPPPYDGGGDDFMNASSTPGSSARSPKRRYRSAVTARDLPVFAGSPEPR